MAKIATAARVKLTKRFFLLCLALGDRNDFDDDVGTNEDDEYNRLRLCLGVLVVTKGWMLDEIGMIVILYLVCATLEKISMVMIMLFGTDNK